MLKIQAKVPLRYYSTIHTGGSAEHFVDCTSKLELIEALTFAKQRHLTPFILGRGSNILFPDDGYSGLIIRLRLNNLNFHSNGTVAAEAGVEWDSLVEQCCKVGLSGIEALSGIPGDAGATPIQNVGAYGQDISETLISLRAMHCITFEEKIFSNHECKFNYRSSVFKSDPKNPWIILEICLKLSTHNEPAVHYDELKSTVEQNSSYSNMSRTEKLMFIREKVIDIRKSKGMILDQNDPDSQSLGSFFVNPIISDVEKQELIFIANQLHEIRPPKFHPLVENQWKISAAWLIENSGFKKGHYFSNARISTKHVLALTNPNKTCTTRDLLNLAKEIQAKVFQTFKINLKIEPYILNSDKS